LEFELAKNTVKLSPLVEPAGELTQQEIERYSRHLIIPEVGLVGQRRIKNAKVLIIGAGGLGSPTLLYLAAAGVGTLGIVDYDTVDESNLQRQVIHSQADLGRSKAVSAKESVLGINPYVNVVLHEVRLDNDNVLEIFSQYDLILDGTDNFATRYLVNDAAAILGKPYVSGSIFRFDGQVSVFWQGQGPTYRDLYPEAPPAAMAPSCSEGGVFGVLCAAIGSVMATEAIKLITGIGDTLLGRLLMFDALEMKWRELPIRKDPEIGEITELIDYEYFCGLKGGDNELAAADSTISVHQLADRLDARNKGADNFVLIDVREPNEYEINRIPGSVLIPRGEFLSGEAFAKLPSDKQIVLHCKSGKRSADALAVVKRIGFTDAVHVGGGVVAWVDEIEPEQARY
jgi:adenylyltransferase/sulfurtransferase